MPSYISIADSEIDGESPITVSLFTRLRDNSLSYLGAPSGTRLVFQQTSAPLGWTKDISSHDDKAIRFTTGTVGSGGVFGFSTTFGKTGTDNTTITIATSAAHNHGGVSGGVTAAHVHTYSGPSGSQTVQGGAGVSVSAVPSGQTTSNDTSDHAHSIASQGSGTGHSHAMDIRVQYADVTISVKD